MARTEDGGGQSGLDDRKGGVVSFMGDVDMAAPQQVLGQDALKTFQNLDPLLLLGLALSQHQQGHGRQRREQLRRADLEEEQQSAEQQGGGAAGWRCSAQRSSTLKMQGTSFLVAWMTSEASTELTEKASSLEDRRVRRTGQTDGSDGRQHTAGSPPPPPPPPHSPQIQHQTGHHTWLSGLSFRNIVEEQLTVRDHGEDPLPALLHAAGLRDLTGDASVTD